MNIFFLDRDVKRCASYHMKKHLTKMPLETCQLLCSAHWMTGSEAPYKLTHKNHPCAIWTRQSIEHYNWLCQLGLALCDEFEFRRGKVHACRVPLEWLQKNLPNIPDAGFQDPPKAMPEDCWQDDVVESYRVYYMRYKSHLAEWENRPTPDWWDWDQVIESEGE